MFIDQEYDLQVAAEAYTRALDAFRTSKTTESEALTAAACELAKRALRFSAFVIADRWPDPNAREREVPATLESLADEQRDRREAHANRELLERVARGPEARIETGPPDPPDEPAPALPDVLSCAHVLGRARAVADYAHALRDLAPHERTLAHAATEAALVIIQNELGTEVGPIAEMHETSIFGAMHTYVHEVVLHVSRKTPRRST